MSKKNNKALLFIAGLALVIGGAYSVSQAVDSSNNNGIILTPGDESSDIALNATSIKMKNVGDTFTLSASVNADATVKSITFTSSDPEAISVTKVNSTSVKLTKLKDFEEFVTITATSDDPFVDLSATCSVRAYNHLTSISGDMNVFYTIDGIRYSCDTDTFDLKTGITYSVSWAINTIFSKFLDTEKYPSTNTYYLIEEEDMLGLKSTIQEVFGVNTISNFTQNSNDSDVNNITFDLVYSADILDEGETLDKTISYNGLSTTITLNSYVVASDLNINQSGTIVL